MSVTEQRNTDAASEESLDLSFFDGPKTIARFPPLDPDGPPRFEYAEYRYLGDYILLQMSDGSKKLGSDALFTLENRSLLAYGEINAFAGDFYGSYSPISDGVTFDDQCTRFDKAFWYLNQNKDRTPDEMIVLKKLMKEEVDVFTEAIRNNEDPSITYSKLKDITYKLIQATIGRPIAQPGYLGRAAINWDHFGQHAHTSYTAGQTLALREASKPDGNLDVAYTINAFADHFLEDSFSAGHIRTPRKELHGMIDKSADYCAKYMHDEESAIGLAVTNRRGDKWNLYGDNKMKNNVDDQNAKLCLEAVQASADEVYAAWKDKKMPAPAKYKIWDIVPNIEQAMEDQKLLVLFKVDRTRGVLQRRVRVDDRRQGGYFDAGLGTYVKTCLECSNSGLWNYPIVLGK